MTCRSLLVQEQHENQRLRANEAARRGMGEGTSLGVGRGMHVTTPPNLGFIRDQPGGNRVARPTALRRVCVRYSASADTAASVHAGHNCAPQAGLPGAGSARIRSGPGGEPGRTPW